MLLSISSTHPPADDLGYLLHKHPDKCQSFGLSFGRAHVFYPEVGPKRCTAFRREPLRRERMRLRRAGTGERAR